MRAWGQNTDRGPVPYQYDHYSSEQPGKAAVAEALKRETKFASSLPTTSEYFFVERYVDPPTTQDDAEPPSPDVGDWKGDSSSEATSVEEEPPVEDGDNQANPDASEETTDEATTG